MAVELQTLDKNAIQRRISQLLEIEPDWTSAGETEWKEEHFKLDLPEKFSLSQIATQNGDLLGYFIASKDKNSAKLHKILTPKEYRGRGIGTQLWNGLLKNCRNQNLSSLEFKVLTDNTNAINLYEKQGCVFTGVTLGNDGKLRHNVKYVFKAEQEIPHSMPMTDSEDRYALLDVMRSNRLATGKEKETLISLVSELSDKKYGVALNSGANALFIALRALKVSGKRVILPSYVCGSVLHAVQNAGAIPVLADLDKTEFTPSLDNIINKITKDTRAIILPHLFGRTNPETEVLRETNILDLK